MDNSLKKNRSIFNSQILSVCFWTTPVILISIFIIIVYKSPLKVTHLSPNEVDMYAYDDRNAGGKSEATLSAVNERELVLKYTLKEGLNYPYAGLRISAPGNSMFDLSSYDFIRIKLRTNNCKRMAVTMGTYLVNYTIPGNMESYRPVEYLIDMTDDYVEMEANLSDFITPNWWFNENKTDFSPIDFSGVKYININHCQLIGKGIEDIVRVKEISFHKNYLPIYGLSALFLVFYYSIAVVIFLKKKRDIKSNVTFQYEKTDTLNQLEEDEKKVFTYLTSHYFNSNLTIIEVQNSIGISENKISGIIKRKTGQSFKQFLNNLRISEAKRLLLETDMQISQIAFQVGYVNPTHFNRVFKELEKCSPNDFRKKLTMR